MSAQGARQAEGKAIGPGRLILVVGPSGSGKDTLIARARAACRDDNTVYFPRRVITRPPSPSEDNDYLPPQAFNEALEHGMFAFWWDAHGLRYAIPIVADEEIAAGKTVVCNGSRSSVEGLRHRYANLFAVLIDAPAEVLKARLTARGRSSDGSLEQRLERNAALAGLVFDAAIDNVASPEEGAAKLLAIIKTR